MYSALKARGQSRFGENYLLFVVSSPLYVGDFIQGQLEQYARGAPNMLAGHAAQWEIKPATAYTSRESFFVDAYSKAIHREIPADWKGEIRRWKR